MATFKITLAYDGTDFVGWQRQASGTSIQGLLEDALRHLDQRDVVVTGAGRTDAGVHALGQVASFTLARSIDGDTLRRAVNARLPDSVRVVAADEVGAIFHARFGATRKVYRYRIWNADLMSPFERAYAWHVPDPLDTGAMRAAATLIEGRRDFASFQAAGSPKKSTEREVFSSVVRGGRDVLRQGPQGSPSALGVLDQAHQPDQRHPPDPSSALSGRGVARVQFAGSDAESAATGSALSGDALIEYEVTGRGFLRHMVRNIVGSLVEIGRGRRPIGWMTTVIDGRDRTLAGPTAPPHGLVLVAVEYGRPSLAAGR